FGMPQGRSGVLRTSCSGLGTQVTPKASLRQLKKYAHGREQKQTSDEKEKWCLLLLTAIFAGRTFHIFLNAFTLAFVMPCVPRTFHSFVPQSFHSLHNLCLHGIGPARFFLRGESGGRPMPIVRARLVLR